jgi:hypothetical protein
MINIKREITNHHTLYRTKVILYRTRTEKGLEAYEIMKRLVYAACRMGGDGGFITYDIFLNFALIWLDKQVNIYEFMSLGNRLKQPFGDTIFGIDVNILVNGTYAQIEQEILNFRENI